jgi:hypothetical protein
VKDPDRHRNGKPVDPDRQVVGPRGERHHVNWVIKRSRNNRQELRGAAQNRRVTRREAIQDPDMGEQCGMGQRNNEGKSGLHGDKYTRKSGPSMGALEKVTT